MLAWLWEPRILWIAIAVPAVVILAMDARSERSIRVAGLVLELIGASLVVVELLRLRRQYKLASPIAWARSWAARVPRRRDVTIHPDSAIGTGGGILGGYLRGWEGAGQNPAVEDRLSAIEKNLESVRDLTWQIEQRLDEEVRNLNAAIDRNGRASAHAVDELRMELIGAHAGGHALTVVGVVWVWLGLILSTASDMILAWVS